MSTYFNACEFIVILNIFTRSILEDIVFRETSLIGGRSKIIDSLWTVGNYENEL